MDIKKGATTLSLALVLVFGFFTLNMPVKAGFGVLCLVDCVNLRSECLDECRISGEPGCPPLCNLLYDACILNCGPESP